MNVFSTEWILAARNGVHCCVKISCLRGGSCVRGVGAVGGTVYDGREVGDDAVCCDGSAKAETGARGGQSSARAARTCPNRRVRAPVAALLSSSFVHRVCVWYGSVQSILPPGEHGVGRLLLVAVAVGLPCAAGSRKMPPSRCR